MSPGPRATSVTGCVAIVATIALLIVGVVAGQPGPQTRADRSAGIGDGATPGSTTATVHTHDTTVAAAPGTPPTEHGHGGEVAASPTDSDAPVGSDAAHDGHTDTSAATAGGEVTDHAHTGEVAASPSGNVPALEHDHTDVAITIPGATIPGATSPTTMPAGHDHGTSTTVPPTTVPAATTTSTVPTGPIISVNDPRLTAEQRAAAVDLIARTRAAMRAFPDEAAVIAAGYVSIGDGVTGFEHYVKLDFLTDGHEVDPQHIESIVLKVAGAKKTVESAMYILSTGKTMADVPDIAGELTTWHDHQNLCWIGTRVVGVTDGNGSCARGELRATAPMLHLWLTEQPCGPFAGIEGHGTSGCHNP